MLDILTRAYHAAYTIDFVLMGLNGRRVAVNFRFIIYVLKR